MKKYTFLTFGILGLLFLACKKDEETKTETPSTNTPLTFTDSRDSKNYKYVKVGTQYWMSEDLKYDGTLTSGSSECYNGSEDTCAKYGRLYDAAGSKVACPSGWHLPSDDEWKTMESYLGMSANDLDKMNPNTSGTRGDGIGDKLKVGGSSKVDLLFGGVKPISGAANSIGNFGNYWTSRDSSVASYTMARNIGLNHSYVKRYWITGVKYCVRCIKD